MKNIQFTSFDGTLIQCYLWDEVENPRAVVQISHGMAEHARRYDDFANYLNRNGIIVFADDHRAHGATSVGQSKKGVKGYHKGEIYMDTVRDEVAITAYLKEKYGLPVIYLGHSYGSMIGQRYIEICKDHAGTILSGSAMMKGALLNTGCAIIGAQYTLCGGEKVGKLADSLSFGSYNKPFKNEGLQYAWLSRDKAQVQKYIDDEECGWVMSTAFFKWFFAGLKTSYDKKNLAQIDLDKPIAIFSGDKDPVGGNGKLVRKLYDQYKKLGVKNLSIKLYPDARHEILNEINNAEVYADILSAITSMI
ncbi:MAG: alpha/beta hydrolase [Bacteroides sp.]|nr:alpha/beta hydrolase [Bacillota bacterium]MCM1393902.1 alpha/beta hydrolase [[Eubacterium] siraeum]MCM1455320.1 alpha/beta hydrolase [Bacteroides sp.]